MSGYFALALKACLERAKLTQAYLAKASGFSTAAISRIAQGSYLPEIDRLGRILDAFPSTEDRRHLLGQYLLDHSPSQYRDSLVITFNMGKAGEPPKDELARALDTLRQKALENQSLRNMIVALGEVIGGRDWSGGRSGNGRSGDSLPETPETDGLSGQRPKRNH
jgi:transcriptional regulator with XRE-family HTH domain